METPVHPTPARAKVPVPRPPRRPALSTVMPRLSILEVPRLPTLPPVTVSTTERAPPPLTLLHLKTRADFRRRLPIQPTPGSQYQPRLARADSTGECRPRTWAGWGDLRSRATCHSIQPLLPVSQPTPTCPARASTPSAAWPRCPSSWPDPVPAPLPAPPRTLWAPARTAGWALWATWSPA